MVQARFDDCSPGGEAVVLSGHVDTLVATRPGEVPTVLAAAERAAAAGHWAAGFVTYEAAPGLDPSLNVRGPDGDWTDGLPLAWFAIFGERGTAPNLDPVGRDQPNWEWPLDAAAWADQVDRVHAAIAAGDTYQLNLTVRLRAALVRDPWAQYRQMVLAGRPAYAAFIDTGRFTVASASPELFFERTPRRVRTKPMKGTSRRGRWPAEDRSLAAELGRSSKERAENVMIVDLVRNDLGRIAEFGSVRVERLWELERYPTLWQLTSTVTARPRADAGIVELFRALFPCGSVTGAPKRRTMELITETERDRRGVYCGAIGWLGPDRTARFSVAIRTVVTDRPSGAAVYGTGSGITWDSRAASEFDEMQTKALILRRPEEPFELLETMAADREGVRNLDLHLDRLEWSADLLGFAFDRGATRRGLVDRAAACTTPSRVRLRLNRDGTVALDVTAFDSAAPRAGAIPPVVLSVDREPVDAGDRMRFHKTTRRGDYERRRARRPDVDDVILVNHRGELVETTVANLAVRIDGCWFTPPMESGCLPGVERRRCLEAGELAESVLTGADLARAEALAVLSSLRGWRAAALAPPGREEGAPKGPLITTTPKGSSG